MIGGVIQECYRSARLPIAVPAASCTVELTPRGAWVMGGSLWIVPDLWKTLEPCPAPKSAFPTRSLDAQNASTRSTGVLIYLMNRKILDEQKKEHRPIWPPAEGGSRD